MTETQFNFGIDKLKDVYGAGKFPEARTKILFERFKGISGEVYIKGIDNLILTCKFAPMMEDFRGEFYDQLQASKSERISNLVKNHPCPKCDSTGRQSIKIKKNEANYSFRCDCRIGNTLYPNFPLYRYGFTL